MAVKQNPQAIRFAAEDLLEVGSSEGGDRQWFFDLKHLLVVGFPSKKKTKLKKVSFFWVVRKLRD